MFLIHIGNLLLKIISINNLATCVTVIKTFNLSNTSMALMYKVSKGSYKIFCFTILYCGGDDQSGLLGWCTQHQLCQLQICSGVRSVHLQMRRYFVTGISVIV